MARAGMTADESIFDGKKGFLDAYRGQDGQAMEDMLEALGKTWELLDPGNYVKRWPCCYSSHRAVGGLQAMLEQHRVETGDVTQVSIGFLPGADTALVSTNPQTGLEGKFSVEYTVAALLSDRELKLETYTDAMVQRPAVRELMAKVRRYRIPNEKTYSGIAGYTDLSLETRRGRCDMRVERVPGSAAWPMTEADRAAKFMDCATRVLAQSAAEKLLRLCQSLKSMPDVRALLHATAMS
jgi:2-methylcitrate dehydratase PrpD